MATIDIALDVAKPQECIEKIVGRRGDTGTVVRATILDDGAPYDFTGRYAELALIRPDGWWVHLRDGVLQEGTTNVWTVELPVEATAYDGLVKLAYFVVRDKEDEQFRDSTQRFLIELDQSVTAEAHFGPYSDQVDKLIREAESVLDAFEAQMERQEQEFQDAQTARQQAYVAAEQERDESYESAEQSRHQSYTTAEAARESEFDTAQQQRAESYQQAEAAREQESDAAVSAANTAAAAANQAAQNVQQALEGDLDPLFGDWIDAQKDVGGGLVSYDKYQQEMVIADGVTLEKSGNTIKVKDAGVDTQQIADSSVTSSKLADGSVTNAKIAGPVSIANGGTGSVTAEGARESLGVVTKLESITLTDEWQDVCGYQLRLPEYDGSTVATSVTINVLTISGLSFIRSIKADTAGSQKTETIVIEQLNGEPYGMVGDGSGYPAFDYEGSVFRFSSRGTTSIGDDHIYRYQISRKGDSYVSGLREFNFFNFLISPSS